MGNLLVPMVAINLIKDVNFTDPYNLWALRGLYFLSLLFIFGSYGLAYLQVKKRGDRTTITVPNLDSQNTCSKKKQF